MPQSGASEVRYATTTDQVSTSVAGEAVILGLRTGVYYGLDRVGARAWALLSEPRLLSELVAAITGEFHVEAAECERDLLQLLGELEARSLVRRITGPHHAGADGP